MNVTQYQDLLTQIKPKPSQDETERKRFLKEIDRLMEIDEAQMTEAEASMLEMLAILVEAYEKQTYPIEDIADPHDILEELVRANDLKQKDLLDIFGSKGIASEVFNRKRSISKAQAKALGQRFNVSPALFL
jgi:HTH-type transcriptional regulator/antitoxin HigA